MANNHWDLSSILSSNKVTTFTNPTTIFETSSPSQTTINHIISPQNTTPSYFNDFNHTNENSTIPLSSLKPYDFVDLEVLKINFNHNSTISTPTTTMHIPTINTLTTPTTIISNIFTPAHTTLIPMPSSPTTITTTTNMPTPTINTLTTPTTIIPTIITPARTTLIPVPSSPTTINTTTAIPTYITTTTATTNTSVQYSNTNSTFFDYPTIIEQQQQQMQLNEFTELEKMLSTLPTTTTIGFTIPTPTITIPTITTMTNTITSFDATNQNASSNDFPILINQQQIQRNNKNQIFVPHSCIKITTTPFDGTYNHPLVLHQPIEHPQQPKSRSMKRKRIYKNRETIECHVSEDQLSKGLGAWRKYGEKTIKGSPHRRNYYKCSSFKDCPARKLVEKSKTNENIYVVTFEGVHNHEQSEVM